MENKIPNDHYGDHAKEERVLMDDAATDDKEAS